MAKVSKIIKKIKPNAKIQIVSTENDGSLEEVNEEFTIDQISPWGLKRIDKEYEFEYIAPVDDRTVEIHCRTKKCFEQP